MLAARPRRVFCTKYPTGAPREVNPYILAIQSTLGFNLKFKTISQTTIFVGKMQSAYRPCYSTETALLCMYNDLLLAVDRGDEAQCC